MIGWTEWRRNNIDHPSFA